MSELIANFFCQWYAKDFVPSVVKAKKKSKKSSEVLLFLDTAPCHPQTEILNVIDNYDFKIMYFPSDITAFIQPMKNFNEKFILSVLSSV